MANHHQQPVESFEVERLAWGIMLLAFAVLCVMCIASSLGVYYFFFESTSPLNTILRVGRGTAVVTNLDSEQAIRKSENLTGRSVKINTDSLSQATLSFYNPIFQSDEQRLIAEATLISDATVVLRNAFAPRFQWSNGIYSIQMRDLFGELKLFIPRNLDYPVRINIFTRDGARIDIEGAGKYRIFSDSKETRVMVEGEGNAILFTPLLNINRAIPDGQTGVWLKGRDEIALIINQVNLIENGLFSLPAISANPTSLNFVPARWGCSSIQDRLPRGVFEPTVWDGRNALRIVRDENASSHGETGCKQFINDEKSNISSYSWLNLQLTFNIKYQSLSECGIAGSECPVMILLQYEDIHGNIQQMYQGFYADAELSSGYPLRCGSCTRDHLKVNPDVWYTFETGNLLTNIPQELKPKRIASIELYASGHQYDVFISEVALKAGFTDVIPPDVFNVETSN
ncbi:hypothetical protein MASR2M15_19970 [Anaerolineales bacterium]